ncbi:putative Bile acid:sodium symporter [Medicago truncatula]|uniref:Putative Bile acid:sodium symporter n=1 Tax=Medicago truncatula TaxID=3880 RepID=A0A396J9R9_MEDTR|nr:putative Bile acid:sodium symporter [Medicago truncatula]
MFAVEVNSSKENFIEAFNRPVELVTAYVGQFVMKPLGYLLCIISVNVFGIPTAIGEDGPFFRYANISSYLSL